MAYHREDSVSSRVSNNGYVFLPSNFKSHNEISSPFEHVIFVLLSLFVNVYIYLFILFIYIYNVLYCFRLFCCLCINSNISWSIYKYCLCMFFYEICLKNVVTYNCGFHSTVLL